MASSNYIMLDKGMSTDDLYKAMLDRGTRVVLMRKGKKFMKATEKQLARLMEGHGLVSKQASCFTTEVPQVRQGERLSGVIERMRNAGIDTFAVTKNGEVIGVLYAPNIEAALQMYLSRASRKTSKNP